MDRSCSTNEAPRVAGETEPKSLGIRTYRQIADVLAKVEGTRMTPRRVAQICRAAETKFAKALLADWVLCERLRSREPLVASDFRELHVPPNELNARSPVGRAPVGRNLDYPRQSRRRITSSATASLSRTPPSFGN